MIRRFLLVVVSVLFIGSAHATSFSGSIDSSEGGGMNATESWGSGGATLGWSVVQLTSGLWQYDYRFTVEHKELSHIIFQVSDNFTSTNLFADTTGGWSLGDWSNEGRSNPGIPDSIYGLKFDGDFSLDNLITIISDRAPMWGDFFAKDGKDGSDWVYAFNSNFGGEYDPYQDYIFGKVLVPDTHTTPVPEPSAWIMFTVGLIGLTALQRRKKTSL